MTLLDAQRSTSTDLSDALRALAAAQQDVVGALARLGGPVTAQVHQLAALISILERRLAAFAETDVDDGHPGLRVPAADETLPPSHDETFVASLREAEAALRGRERVVELPDPEHPTITQLVRLQAELVGASLAPLMHVLAELVIDADALERAILDRGALAAATIGDN